MQVQILTSFFQDKFKLISSHFDQLETAEYGLILRGQRKRTVILSFYPIDYNVKRQLSYSLPTGCYYGFQPSRWPTSRWRWSSRLGQLKAKPILSTYGCANWWNVQTTFIGQCMTRSNLILPVELTFKHIRLRITWKSKNIYTVYIYIPRRTKYCGSKSH